MVMVGSSQEAPPEGTKDGGPREKNQNLRGVTWLIKSDCKLSEKYQKKRKHGLVRGGKKSFVQNKIKTRDEPKAKTNRER